jgi:hypothetical protein
VTPRQDEHLRGGRASARAARDQEKTAFTAILAELIARIPGARAAALVDFGSETVDYAGELDPFDMRVAAAHFRIVLDDAAAQSSLRDIRFLAVRAGRRSYLGCMLPEGYALIVVLARAAGFGGWQRAVAVAAWALRAEAGWTSGDGRPLWFPVDVLCDRRFRPVSVQISGRTHPVDVLGVVARGELYRREKGWRVRLGGKLETTLLREPGGAWYADAPVGDLSAEARK